MFSYAKHDDFFIFCNYMITGAIAFGETEGFWIISSVPRFPWPASGSTGYNYGESQTKKGQIILCVTVPENMEDKISKIQCTRDPLSNRKVVFFMLCTITKCSNAFHDYDDYGIL